MMQYWQYCILLFSTKYNGILRQKSLSLLILNAQAKSATIIHLPLHHIIAPLLFIPRIPPSRCIVPNIVLFTILSIHTPYPSTGDSIPDEDYDIPPPARRAANKSKGIGTD